MQISVLEKLLQLISPKNSPEEEKSLEEILEQKETQSNEEEFEIQNSEFEINGEEEEMTIAEEPAEKEEPTEKEKPAHAESNRSHLTSSVPRGAKTPQSDLTKGELAQIRSLFANLDDKEIQRLYKKVTK